MRGREATERFEQSKRLFAEGRYIEALQILEALDEEFPHQKNVLYPKALCLAKLGRTHEALAICHRLVREFQDPRAEQLRDQLQAAAQPAPPAAPAMPIFQPIQLDDLAPKIPYKRREEVKESPWRAFLVYGGTALVTIVVALLVIGFLARLASRQAPTPDPTPTATSTETQPESAYDNYPPPLQSRIPTDISPLQALVALLTIVGGGFPLYFTLFMIDKLPFNDFWKDFLHAWTLGALASLIGQVCCCIAFVWFIFVVKRTYDLENAETGMWVVLVIVYWVMQYFIFRAAGIW